MHAKPRLVTLALALTLALPLPLTGRAETQPPGAPIAALSGDWNGDAASDAVLLVRAADGMADLVLYQGNPEEGLQPLITLPGAISAGPLAGSAPALESRGERGFAIVTQQTGFGRTPWTQAVTVAFRNGTYMVAGFDYDFYDRLDLSHYGGCSVNLLTGRFTLTLGPGDEAPEVHRAGPVGEAAFPLAALTDGYWPPACDALMR